MTPRASAPGGGGAAGPAGIMGRPGETTPRPAPRRHPAMTAPSTAGYQSYRGLPTLAGLATIEQAARPGLGVEAVVARLKRFHYAFLRLHEVLTARITAEPVYELKT